MAQGDLGRGSVDGRGETCYKDGGHIWGSSPRGWAAAANAGGEQRLRASRAARSSHLSPSVTWGMGLILSRGLGRGGLHSPWGWRGQRAPGFDSLTLPRAGAPGGVLCPSVCGVHGTQRVVYTVERLQQERWTKCSWVRNRGGASQQKLQSLVLITLNTYFYRFVKEKVLKNKALLLQRYISFLLNFPIPGHLQTK